MDGWVKNIQDMEKAFEWAHVSMRMEAWKHGSMEAWTDGRMEVRF